jgi:hypothetical protein
MIGQANLNGLFGADNLFRKFPDLGEADVVKKLESECDEVIVKSAK